MSDLYTLHVTDRRDLDPEQVAAEAAALGMNPGAVRRSLSRARGALASFQVVVNADHSDASPLDALTPGLVHFLLSETSEALATHFGGLTKINRVNFSPDVETSPIAYAAVEGDKRSLTLRVWGPAALAPAEGTYCSTAWVVDRGRFAHHKPASDHRRFPPPGVAGALSLHASNSATAFPDVKRLPKVVGLACLGDRVFALANKGGHIAVLSAPYAVAVPLGTPPADQAKVAYKSIRADGNRLIIVAADGAAYAVDPDSGERTRVDPPPASDAADRLSAQCGDTTATIDAKGTLALNARGETSTIATGITRPSALVSTSGPEDWLVISKEGALLVHVPTKSITARLESMDHVDALHVGEYLISASLGAVTSLHIG